MREERDEPGKVPQQPPWALEGLPLKWHSAAWPGWPWRLACGHAEEALPQVQNGLSMLPFILCKRRRATLQVAAELSQVAVSAPSQEKSGHRQEEAAVAGCGEGFCRSLNSCLLLELLSVVSFLLSHPRPQSR